MGAQIILCDPHRAAVIGMAREQRLRGITMSSPDIRAGVALLIAALSAEGTRLCIITSVTPQPNGGYEVRITEGACTAGVTSSEPYCAFTLGVFIGAVSAITGHRMIGRETECAAGGHPECVYQIEPIA